MEQTPKYGLKKPGGSDYVDVAVLNEDMDKIEAALDGLEKGKEGLLKNAAGKTTPLGADSLVLIDSAESNKTKRVTMTALALAIDMLNGVYDVVIRTQAEFNQLIASPTWLNAVSVCFVGDGGTLKFISRGRGIKIPQTVKQIQGINVAIIEVTEFYFNPTNDKGGLWYDTLPTANDYSICNITLNCTSQVGPGVRSNGFCNCAQLLNCTGTGIGGTEAGTGVGFSNCTGLINCTGFGAAALSASAGTGMGFLGCTKLINCTGTGKSTGNVGFGVGFEDCTQLTNCAGTGISTGTGSGYGFYNCSYLTGYKQGASASTTALLGGKNTFITLTEENLVEREKLAVASSAWVADSTLSAQGFMFRAAIPCVGVTKDHHPNVSFSCADAMAGNFAPVADSYDGGIYIYCKKKPTISFVIPSIVCLKGV